MFYFVSLYQRNQFSYLIKITVLICLKGHYPVRNFQNIDGLSVIKTNPLTVIFLKALPDKGFVIPDVLAFILKRQNRLSDLHSLKIIVIIVSPAPNGKLQFTETSLLNF